MTMKYYDDLHTAIGDTQVTARAHTCSVKDGGVDAVAHYLNLHCQGAIAVIGNGGSAAIASHVVTDLIKRGVAATALNDPAVMTCLTNDYGYQDAYARQIRAWHKHISMLIAVSSSGQSGNILLAAQTAKSCGMFVMTFSGFMSGNDLRRMGDVSVWTPSSSYGHVEMAHQAILHDAVERLTEVDTVKAGSKEAPTGTVEGFARISAMAQGDGSSTSEWLNSGDK